MNEEVSHLLNTPGVTIKKWCSFCNSRPGEGQVKLALAPEVVVDLTICEICVEQAKAEGYEVVLTDPTE